MKYCDMYKDCFWRAIKCDGNKSICKNPGNGCEISVGKDVETSVVGFDQAAGWICATCTFNWASFQKLFRETNNLPSKFDERRSLNTSECYKQRAIQGNSVILSLWLRKMTLQVIGPHSRIKIHWNTSKDSDRRSFHSLHSERIGLSQQTACQKRITSSHKSKYVQKQFI